jgi:hypothetical protein
MLRNIVTNWLNSVLVLGMVIILSLIAFEINPVLSLQVLTVGMVLMIMLMTFNQHLTGIFIAKTPEIPETLAPASVQLEVKEGSTGRIGIVQDETRQDFYFVNSVGIFRKIPDRETKTYLTDVIGLEEIGLISKQQILKKGAGDLKSVRDWEPELTPREKELKALTEELKVELLEAKIDIAAKKLRITLMNRGSQSFTIASGKYLGADLPLTSINPIYPKAKDDITLIIPVNKQILPAETLSIGIELSQNFSTRELRQLSGAFGYFYLEIPYKNEVLDKMIVLRPRIEF